MKTKHNSIKWNLLSLLASSALLFNTAHATLSTTNDYGIQGKASIATDDVDSSATDITKGASILRAATPDGFYIAGTYLKDYSNINAYVGSLDASGKIDRENFTTQPLVGNSYTPQAKFILLSPIGDPFLVGEGSVTGESNTVLDTAFIVNSSETTDLVKRLSEVISKDLQAVQTSLNARTLIGFTTFDENNLSQIVIQEYDMVDQVPLSILPQITNQQAAFTDNESQRLALLDLDLENRIINVMYNYIFNTDYNNYGTTANKIAIVRYTTDLEVDTTYGTQGVKQILLDDGAQLLKITDLSINRLGSIVLNNEAQENSIVVAANIIQDNIYKIYLTKTSSANDVLLSNAGTTIYNALNLNEFTTFSGISVAGNVTSTNNFSGQVWPYMWNDQPKITFGQSKPVAGNVQFYNCTPDGLDAYIRNYVLVGTQHSVTPEFSMSIGVQTFLINGGDYRIGTQYYPQLRLFGLKDDGELDTTFNEGSITLFHKTGVELRARKALYNISFADDNNTYTLYTHDSLTVGDLVYWADQTTGNIFTLYTLPTGNKCEIYQNNSHYATMNIDDQNMNYRLYYSVYDKNGTPLKLGQFLRDTNSQTYSIQSVSVNGDKVNVLGNGSGQSSLISLDFTANDENPTALHYTGPSDFTLDQDGLNPSFAYSKVPTQLKLNLSDYLSGGGVDAALEYSLSNNTSGHDGTLALDDTRTSILYTPKQYFTGKDTILFYVMNTAATPEDSSSSYQITIKVIPPDLGGDGFTYANSIPFALTYDYLETDAANCIDEHSPGTGGPLTVQASFGTARFNTETRKIEYKLPDNFFGAKLVQFTVTDDNAPDKFFIQLTRLRTTLPQDLVELNSPDMLTSVNLNNSLKVTTTDNLLIVGSDSETPQLLLSSVDCAQNITTSNNLLIASKVSANQIYVGEAGTLALTNSLNLPNESHITLSALGASFNVTKNMDLSDCNFSIGDMNS